MTSHPLLSDLKRPVAGPPPIFVGRWGETACQVNYARHRTSGRNSHLYGDAFGRVNIAFADGHVELLRHDELFDVASNRSNYRAMWSPIDREVDAAATP